MAFSEIETVSMVDKWLPLKILILSKECKLIAPLSPALTTSTLLSWDCKPLILTNLFWGEIFI